MEYGSPAKQRSNTRIKQQLRRRWLVEYARIVKSPRSTHAQNDLHENNIYLSQFMNKGILSSKQEHQKCTKTKRHYPVDNSVYHRNHVHDLPFLLVDERERFFFPPSSSFLTNLSIISSKPFNPMNPIMKAAAYFP